VNVFIVMNTHIYIYEYLRLYYVTYRKKKVAVVLFAASPSGAVVSLTRSIEFHAGNKTRCNFGLAFSRHTHYISVRANTSQAQPGKTKQHLLPREKRATRRSLRSASGGLRGLPRNAGLLSRRYLGFYGLFSMWAALGFGRVFFFEVDHATAPPHGSAEWFGSSAQPT
jgi:hypothetical protein